MTKLEKLLDKLKLQRLEYARKARQAPNEYQEAANDGVSQGLELAASIIHQHYKPVEEQADVLGFDNEGKEYVEPDLNQYAGTISQVFEKLVCLYAEESSTGEWDEAGMSIVGILDADVCGEIITVAQAIEEQS